jgi:hypothetical protein
MGLETEAGDAADIRAEERMGVAKGVDPGVRGVRGDMRGDVGAGLVTDPPREKTLIM